MKNKIYILFYLFLLGVIIVFSYNFYDTKELFFNKKVILSLNDEAFLQYKEKFDLNKSFSYIWGFKRVQTANKKQKVDINSKLLEVTQKGNLLCVHKDDCFRFLGIFKKHKKLYTSFYNKNFRHGIDDFTISDTIGYDLSIKKIFSNRVIIQEKNTSRVWEFQLFDVNTTKYKPKDINATSF